MAIAIVPVVFGVFPLVHSMASNADSLVLFDLAHDIWTGNVLRTWNLPRAPYLFPDTVIALLVMSIGWLDQYSIWAVATINDLILVLIVHQVFVHATGFQQLRLWQTGALMNCTLLVVGLCFPFAMVNVYWQLLASGAHFLTAIVVLEIFYLLSLWKSNHWAWVLSLIFGLVFLEALSDSMSALLLGIWLINQFFWRYCIPSSQVLSANTGGDDRNTTRSAGARNGKDLGVTLIAIILGTTAGGLLPRQSLLESFFSLDKFWGAVLLFKQWLVASPTHLLFIALLIFCALVYPVLFKFEHAQKSELQPLSKIKKLIVWLCVPTLLPSLAIIVITPLFYQELGSLRYLAFPALLCLMVASGLAYKLFKKVAHSGALTKCLVVIGLLGLISALTHWDLRHDLIGPKQVTSGRDAIGLSAGADTSGALACIASAAQYYPLADGVATYWNARPTRFASHFGFYLAQINPWRPRAGYFLWGNNGIDFVYSDRGSQKQSIRSYNFVLATKPELAARLWGSLPLQAAQTIQCAEHTVFYFENPAVLWQYLFPLGAPYINEASVNPLAQNSLLESTPSRYKALEVMIPTPQSNGAVHTYLGDDLSTQTGARDGSSIRTNEQDGFLVYGPYISLPKGRYRLAVTGHLQAPHMPIDKPIGTIDVSTNFGKTILTAQAINSPLPTSKTITQLDFELERDSSDIEFRIQVGSAVEGFVGSYQLQRIGAD